MQRRQAWLLALSIVVVAYGSLFPFQFDWTMPRGGIVAAMLASLHARPSRGDVVANLVLYLPIGFFWAQCFSAGGVIVRIGLGTVFGALMSAMIETLQLFDNGRDPSLHDVINNTLSTLAGAILGWAFRFGMRRAMAGTATADASARLIAASWIGYRLAPFVPSLDLQHVRNALKPLLHASTFMPVDAARHAAAWLAFAALLEGGLPQLPVLLGLLLAMSMVLAGKLLVVGKSLALYEAAGAAAGFVLWGALVGRLRRRHAVVAVTTLVAVTVDGLMPFNFMSASQGFSWIPFVGFIRGQILTAILALFQKIFWYGAPIWLLHRAGWPLWASTLGTAGVLLAVEIAQTRLANHTPEISDPLMAVFIALVILGLKPPSAAREQAKHAPLPVRPQEKPTVSG